MQHIGHFETEEGPLIVRDSSNILIPQEARKDILRELHSTHLSTEYMKALARGRFFWPNYQEDIKKTSVNVKIVKEKVPASPPNPTMLLPPI